MLDFAELGKYRENNRIEAKKALGGLPKSIWETYSAFANTIGGIILLGVEEQKDGYFALAGLRNAQSLREEFWQKVNDKRIVSQNILASADVYVHTEAEGEIVVIQVPRAQTADKPIYIGRDIYNGSYCRNGEGDFRCSRDEVRLMLAKRSEVMPDNRLLKQCDLTDLCAETIELYREKVAKRRPAWAKLPTAELLRKLGAVGAAGDGELYPTAAGLLMFGRNKAIKSEFPDYFLDYRCYRETNRLSERLTSADGNWSGNVCDFYFLVCAAVLKNLKHSKREMIYPILQEGLANALIHANYYAKRGLLVEQEQDLITIANPGGMRLSLKEAKMGIGSDLRNQNLSNMFKYIGIAKQKGHGVAYIYEAWQNLGFDAPKLSDNRSRTVLSLCLREDDDIDRTERRKNMLIAYLTDNITITRRQAAEYLHISPQTAAKYLHQLTDEQIVQVDRLHGEKVYRLKT